VAEELLDRIDTPAGVDIGARTPAEIALSILTRVVEVRRARFRPAPASAADTGATPEAGACCHTAEERSDPARRDG
jgi:xanthine dehydrogenase accessory factor